MKYKVQQSRKRDRNIKFLLASNSISIIKRFQIIFWYVGLIRFLLACFVILSHTSTIFGYNLIPSFLAVQTFYIISGFYMSLVLNEKYQKGSTVLFFKNRLLKIYPVYWLVLFLLITSSFYLYLTGHPGTIAHYAKNHLSIGSWIFFIVINLFIVGYELCFFFNVKDGNLIYTKSFGNSLYFGFNSIGWTISLELIFYVLAPFILRKSIKVIIVLLLISLIIRIILTLNGLSDAPWNYMFFPTQIMFFMAGNLAYRLYGYIKDHPMPRYLLKIQYGILLIIIIFYSYLADNSYYLQSLLFIALTTLIPASFQLTKNNKVDRYLGNLSYPLYISQFFVITFTVSKKFPKIFGLGFTTLFITIFLSVIIYEFLSKRVEKKGFLTLKGPLKS